MENRTKLNIRSPGIKRLRQLLILKRGTVQTKQERKEKEQLIKQYYNTEDYKWLKRTIGQEYRRAVIKRGNFTKEQWLEILKFQKNRCKYCNKEFSKKNPATVDHIIPINSHLSGIGTYKVRKVRGTHSIKNIVAACRLCNITKNAHPPRELLFKRTNSRIRGGKSQSGADNIPKVPISRVREWYIENALKLVAKKSKKRTN